MVAKPSFTVRVDDNLIFVVFHGRQDLDQLTALHQKTQELLRSTKGIRHEILMDVHDSEPMDAQALQLSLQYIHESPFRRMAAFGVRHDVMQFMESLRQSGESNERLKFFADEALAREWLGAGKPKLADSKPTKHRQHA